MSWLLRHGAREHTLADGEHYVGRGDECTVRLDDALASRRHAAFTVRGGEIHVRDLDSRNGVFVKQQRLARGERIALSDGDAVLIGKTTLQVLYRAKQKRESASSDPPTSPTTPGRSLANTNQVMSHETFLAECDRTLALGEMERFARATHLLLASLAAAVGRGLPEDNPAIRSATKHALRLADQHGVEWVEELLTLYEGRPLVLPIEAVTSLKELFARERWKSPAMERYVERVRPLLEGGGARGRALLRELESIGRREPSARPTS
jgi:hypothetical protein